MTKIYLFLFALLFAGAAFAQEGAPSCAELQANFQQYQSCATSIPFQNSSTPSTENFNTSCIEQPLHGPTWFFMKIKTPGDIFLQISQLSDLGQQADVDFVLWGPFPNLFNICNNLNISNEVDCSWSALSIENVTLLNAQAGELYILLVDNYDQVPGQITISQTGGSGSSDCSFLSSVEITETDGSAITQFDYCQPATKNIMAKVDTTDFSGNPADLRFNYVWYKDGIAISTITASASSTNTISVTDSGTYSVDLTAYDSTDPTVNQATLPVSNAQVLLNFYFSPDFTLQLTNSQCLDSNPVLQAVDNSATPQAYTFEWHRNGNLIPGAQNPSYTPTQPGNYTVKVSNPGCPPLTSNVVSIYAKPLVLIADNKTICEDDTYQITSVLTNFSLLSAPAYQWYKDGIALSGATNPTLTVSTAIQAANTTAAYTLEVTEQGLCTGISNAVSITVNARPNINTTPVNLLQCDYISPNNDGFATVDLTQAKDVISNNDSQLVLSYFLDAGLTQPIANPAVFTNTTPFSQTIYVNGKYPNQNPVCTSSVATIVLTVNPTSLSAYPNMAPVCPELNANYGLVDFDAQRALIKNTYYPATAVDIRFYATPQDASVEQNELTNASQIGVGLSTIYTRIEAGINCQSIGTFTVEVLAAPIQNTVSNLEACKSETVILSSKDAEALAGQNASVTASYFYTFANARDNVNAINKNAAVNLPVGSNPIFVRLSDNAIQCFSVVTFNVVVYPNPVIVAPLQMSVCGSLLATFDLTLRNAAITGGNPNYQVLYYETQADLNANNPILNQTSYQSGTKTIAVKVIDVANHNCESYTTLSLKVTVSPGNTANPEILQICDDSGFSTFDLTQREFQMAGITPRNTITFRYYENAADADAGNANTINSAQAFTNTISGYQKIYVRITSTVDFDSESGLACYRVLEQELFVRPFPENKLLRSSYKICVDQNAQVVNKAIIDAELPASDYNFLWFRGFDADPAKQVAGAYGPVFSTGIAGEYSVRITDITNSALCATVANFTTEMTVIPFSVQGSPAELIAFETDNTITAIAMPASTDYLYQLNDNGWQQSNVFTNIREGVYTLTVKNLYGCGEASTEIVVVDFPRYFTPNNDGFNDTWNIGGRLGLDVSDVFVFDRNGKLVKEIYKDETGWDGTLNGKPLPADDYWFKIIYRKNGAQKEFRSHFALKR